MILITGGNGSIGSELIKMFLAEGKEVVSVGRKAREVEGYIYEACDLGVAENVENLFKKYDFDLIIHLAAMLNTASNTYPAEAFEANVLGTYHLLKMNIEKKAKFIYGSSINAYGYIPTDEDNWADESTASVPNDFYSITKCTCERMGAYFAKTYGFEFVAARIPIIVGPGQASPTSLWREKVFTSVRDGEPVDFLFGKDTPPSPIAHVQDTVKPIYILCNQKAQSNLYNLPCEVTTMGVLADAIHSVNPDVKVSFGTRRPPSSPDYVCCKKFLEEFDYKLVPLADQIKAYKE